MASHQRRNKFHHTAGQLIASFFLADTLRRNLAALSKGILKIFFNIPDAAAPVQKRSALKMMIKAPVIQIDRPYHRFYVITEKTFAWTKPGVYS